MLMATTFYNNCTIGGVTFDAATIRVSLHTANPEAPTLNEIMGGTVIGTLDGSAYARARIEAQELEMDAITWNGAQVMISSGEQDYIDPYDLQADATSGGIGDPLAEVRGLSYDDTLRAIDEALNGKRH